MTRIRSVYNPSVTPACRHNFGYGPYARQNFKLDTDPNHKKQMILKRARTESNRKKVTLAEVKW